MRGEARRFGNRQTDRAGRQAGLGLAFGEFTQAGTQAGTVSGSGVYVRYSMAVAAGGRGWDGLGGKKDQRWYIDQRGE